MRGVYTEAKGPTFSRFLAADPTTASTPLTECALDWKTWLILEDFTAQYGLANFSLVTQGDLTQIWAQNNLAWPRGDPRPTPEIFCEQTEYVLGEFDNNMYPTEDDFFGPPDSHDASGALLPSLLGYPSDYYTDAAGRQVILISNIRDEN